MNIKRAKEEIENAIRAYLERDEDGNFEIAPVRQRPILLMGPPGIGKTAIMEQVARDCGIALVSYTITHHTRQSAIGLPFLQKKQYDGREYTVTEYTMSEIIASVYEKMEQTGLQNGILFLDEINCVSETLAPTMLQFLQNKTFGSHHVPEGWIIIAAGNPPEYNKSVRDFDLVTLDRVKKMDIEADYAVWKEYAYRRRLHNAILSYLEIKRDNFYVVETTVDGKEFVTARGWEDLSEMLYASEKLGLPVDEAVISQYLQHRLIAKDFANYYDLYQKYQQDYHVEEILEGHIRPAIAERLKSAPFDERFSVISLLLGKLFSMFTDVYLKDMFVTGLYEQLKRLKASLGDGTGWETVLDGLIADFRNRQEQAREAGLSDRDEQKTGRRILLELEHYRQTLKSESIRENPAMFQRVKELFSVQPAARKESISDASGALDNAFCFMEQVFGESQELVVFLTELTMNFYSMKFINENGCAKYYTYNRSLLTGRQQKRLLSELDALGPELELL